MIIDRFAHILLELRWHSLQVFRVLRNVSLAILTERIDREDEK
jgi:hypothetical protein